ncbi:hypothetical protein ABMA27_011613 [Loxostege sticticalis]|uniref:Uncharacterized protein n=1 Tax=Loxostege sticticalis TaxID=481309 RepID=A0ABR3IGV5_LOXSC
MLEQRAEQTDLQVEPQRTATLETNNKCKDTCDVRKKKKFARLRSPWRKRQSNCKDAGDLLDKGNPSCEFIMTPKDLSRPASDCCCQPSCNRSNVSAETHASKKTVVKSYSSDRADFEKQNFTPIEVIKPEGDSSKYLKLTGTKSEVQPDTDPKLRKLTNDVICQCPEEKIEVTNVGVQCVSCVGMNKEASKDSPLSNRNTNDVKVQREGTTVDKKALIGRPLSDKNANDETVRDEDRAKPYRASEKNTSCQCSEIVLVKRDAQSQYIRDLTDAICCCCLSYEYRPMCRASSQNPSHILLSQCACSPYPTPLEPELRPIIKDTRTTFMAETPKTVPITYASGEVQTSDHSICLDKATYPLFMKIVCADKLNEEFVCKSFQSNRF